MGQRLVCHSPLPGCRKSLWLGCISTVILTTSDSRTPQAAPVHLPDRLGWLLLHVSQPRHGLEACLPACRTCPPACLPRRSRLSSCPQAPCSIQKGPKLADKVSDRCACPPTLPAAPYTAGCFATACACTRRGSTALHRPFPPGGASGPSPQQGCSSPSGALM